MDQPQGCLTKLKQQELNPYIRLLLNSLLLFLVGCPVLLFSVFGSPYQRGFYCSDDSLSYPLLPDTISTGAVIIGGLLIPIVAILIVEIVKDSSDNHDKEEDFLKKCLHPKVITIATALGYFLFGCGCLQTITEVVKYGIGRLRPHFHAVCQTDWDSIKANCSDSLQPVYIYPIPCLNEDQHEINKARLSFFSGHASFSAFTMIYLIFYLENRLTWHHPKLLKPFIQFFCLLLTVYTSISRIFDYHHHWSDVLFGFAFGCTMAYIIARYVSGLVKVNRSHNPIVDQEETV